MAGALPPHIQLLLRPWGAGAILIIAVAGLRVNDLCLPHQPLTQPHAEMASAHIHCQPGWQEKRKPEAHHTDPGSPLFSSACCRSAHGPIICKN